MSKTNDKLGKCIFSSYHEGLLEIEKKKKNRPIGKWIKDMNRLLTAKD